MALFEHLQDFGSHGLHICLSQESLNLYIQDASASVKHSLELQGSQDKRHSCTAAVVPPLEQAYRATATSPQLRNVGESLKTVSTSCEERIGEVKHLVLRSLGPHCVDFRWCYTGEPEVGAKDSMSVHVLESFPIVRAHQAYISEHTFHLNFIQRESSL